ncbi:hypothetical protein [uncultured Lamprocystis sp.]|uniref:hypothetical protein n=1 Tax=uncultured Lamprocystis sp. TaxID=543132 RepID=UPI0025CBB014|nr:hypothetical protein [uncultured Lamprocystis sp.]
MATGKPNVAGSRRAAETDQAAALLARSPATQRPDAAGRDRRAVRWARDPRPAWDQSGKGVGVGGKARQCRGVVGGLLGMRAIF